MTIWKPGMFALCVNSNGTNLWNIPELQEHRIYTVAVVELLDGIEGLRLDELPIRTACGTFAPSQKPFYSWRFRPLCETRLDQFRQHLAPVDRERADA